MKTSAYIWFDWQLPNPGSVWIDAHPVKSDWTIDRKRVLPMLVHSHLPPGWQLYSNQTIQPLKMASALFCEFAALEPTQEKILEFATKYGPLTHGRLCVWVEAKVKYRKPEPACALMPNFAHPSTPQEELAEKASRTWLMQGAKLGDSLDYWRSAIYAMRALVQVWQALSTGGKKPLEQFVRTETEDRRLRVTLVDEAGAQVDTLLFNPVSSIQLSRRDAIEYALVRAIGRRTLDGARLGLFAPESEVSQHLAIVPRSLQDAMWLQFALAVLDQKRFRECEVCGRPFEVSPDTARTNRTLCSAACKAKAHRKRRDLALKLAELGKKPQQIAKQVGSQLSTVQKWLKESKG
jgi:hypothetical protein